MQRSLGVHVDGAALPMSDVGHIDTIVAGVVKRFACAIPERDPHLIRALRSFVRVFIRKNCHPLLPGDLKTVQSWLDETHYNDAEKRRFLELDDQVRKLAPKHFRCKLFGKRETFTSYKHARCINSRHDVFKVKTGRYFAAIEKQLFGKYDLDTPGCPPDPAYPLAKYFIKHVPVDRRAEYIDARLGGRAGFIYATDYTSFEALFSPELMRAVEFQLYTYLWRNVELGHDMAAVIASVLGRVQQIRGRNLRVAVPGCRMSGEMCTSLGNGFTNLAVMAFVCNSQHVQWDGVVEGDDGLFVTDRELDPSMFERLGLRIKLVRCASVGDAGFCKHYYDEQDLTNVVNPRELLCKFGWTHSPLKCGGERVMRGLLRGKAFSLKADMASAPIASSLWRMVFRCIGDGEVLFEGKSGRKSYWESVKLTSTTQTVGTVGMRSRLLVDRLFGVSVETQLEIEKYLDGMTTLHPLSGPVLSLMEPSWFDYWGRYVVMAESNNEIAY